ncbi:MAG TPA: DUF1552 domain-containing protein [Polyangiaceae bacterium LLY-WYZ-14_1]|nr:DUF1552 domain-containing protein [Polyangiaceae bacterium LLY-WYZ-14_1]
MASWYDEPGRFFRAPGPTPVGGPSCRPSGVSFSGGAYSSTRPKGTSAWWRQSGTIGALTARTTEGTRTGTGPSLDQFIAQELRARGVVTPKRSLLWGLYDRARPPFFEGPGQPIAPIANPWTALADLAPALGGEAGGTVDRALRRQHFVLDQVARDCARLRGRLGGEGRAILEQHCANIEALETSVSAALTTSMASCEAPDAPDTTLPADFDWTGREARDEACRAFTEMMGLAFACDLTRVIGFGFGNGAARFSIPERYGVPVSGRVDSGDSGPQMHAWTHQRRDDPNTTEALRIFYHWFSEKVVAIVEKLKNTNDADGRPLLDTTLVLWTSEFGQGGPHHNGNVPVMLFGSSEGAIETGRHFHAGHGDRESKALVLHQLMVSICRHMGLDDIDTFGNAGRGPLDWLAG